jgi:S-adenosylmethionine decarboxylase
MRGVIFWFGVLPMSYDVTAELGMNEDAGPTGIQDNETGTYGAYEEAENGKDYFVEKDGVKFAGTHLLLDLWGAENLDSPEMIDEALRGAAVAAGATILHSHFHHFTPNGGVSGVVVLAESHISIHTWPERNFAAVDIFMCGECNPYDGVPMLRDAFRPDNIQLSENRRGMVL